MLVKWPIHFVINIKTNLFGVFENNPDNYEIFHFVDREENASVAWNKEI